MPPNWWPRLFVPVVVAAVVLFAIDGRAHAAPVTRAPTVSGPTTVTGPGNRAGPDVAFDGTNSFVVWQQKGSADWDIYGRRLSSTGSPLGAAFPIATDAADEVNPAVAWNGTSFLVVYQHAFSSTDWDVYAKHVSASGGVGLDTYAVSYRSTQEQSPDVVGAGPNFLVVWQDKRTAANGFDIWADGFQGNGGTLGEFYVGGAEYTGDDTAPAVAYTGGDTGGPAFLVTWQHAFGSVSGVLARRTNLAQTIDPFSLYVSDPNFSEDFPAVASDGSRFLVVWRRNTGSGFDIRGAWVDSTAHAGFPISSAPNNQDSPTVSYDGTYLVAWRDERTLGGLDIYAARVTTGGTVSDPSGFVVANGAANEGSPAVTEGSGGKWGAVYRSGGNPSASIFLRSVSPK